MEKFQNILDTFKHLTNLNEKNYKVLSDEKEILKSWTEEVIKNFYDALFSYEKTKSIPKEEERIKLEKTLSQWYLDIVNGDINDDFWQKQWYVGLAHIARNVDNSYMIAMMNLLQEHFAQKCFSTFEVEKALELSLAFNKITSAILAVIVNGYIDLYMEALERMSGIKKSVVERMASLESKKMFEEYKKGN